MWHLPVPQDGLSGRGFRAAPAPSGEAVTWSPLNGRVDPRTLVFLAGRSVAVRVAETREAVKIYSDLAGSAPVAGLFHSTC